MRIILVTLSLGAVLWSIRALREELDTGPFEAVADRISIGQQYRPEAIQRAIPYLDQVEQRPGCSRVFRDAAIIRAQARQMVLADNKRAESDIHLARAIQDLEQDLSCAPTRAYSWLMLFTMLSLRDGSVRNHLPLLTMSYRMGPNEGSFTPLRSRASLALLGGFGPHMTAAVESEYRLIIRDQPYIAGNLFAEMPPPVRVRLTNVIKTAPAAARAVVVSRLEQLDIPIPPEIQTGKR